MTHHARFVPARELAAQLARSIEPRLRNMFPETPMTLAFIGAGSDVIGYDTARSMDHDWGPRLTVIVLSDMSATVARKIDERLDDVLPGAVVGIPTRYSRHADGTAFMDEQGTGHRIQVTSVEDLLRSVLFIDSVAEISDAVWLSTPMQALLELTSGDVFVDDSGVLTDVRQRLNFYPDHIWRYQLAGLWMRVSQVQPFIGRCFEVGDPVGAATIALGVVRDLMRIGILQSRQYAPYAKWLGTAFARTEIGRVTLPGLDAVINNAADFHLVEESINGAGSDLIRQLNDLELIAEVDPSAEQFHDRPYRVLPAERIAHALRASLLGTDCERFPPFVGGIDLISDSTDALGSQEFRHAVRVMFELNQR